MPATELLHTMIRILDEERSLAFYRALGFEERGRKRVGGDTATIIFMGLPGDGDRLELTLNDGRTEPYELGTAYGHIALSITDLDGELARLAGMGITPEKEPYSAYPGGSRICFVQDPDGYRIEFIEAGSRTAA
ncbi:MAG: VOC family protein [Thermoleophilia bacterium]